MKRILAVCLCLLMTINIGAFAIEADSFDYSVKEVTIYYPDGDWQYQPVHLEIPQDEKNPYLYALNALLKGEGIPDGCYNEFPDNAAISSCKFEKDTVFVEFDKDMNEKVDNLNYSYDVMTDIISYNIFKFVKYSNISYKIGDRSLENHENISSSEFFGDKKEI